jgi:beta-glucanase (GH16 family)
MRIPGERSNYGRRKARQTVWRFFLCVTVTLSGFFGTIPAWQSHAAQSKPGKPSWVLSWSDEFSGLDGAPPDPAKWVVETGGNGWGNQELEYYTARRENVRQEDGNLVIEARRERYTGPDGVARDYTSARLKTNGRFSQKFGRFEARLRLPYGLGMWPAFWMLGDDFSTAGWPACGEIDIMENKGAQRSTVSGAVHGPGYSGGHALVNYYSLPEGQFSDAFHVFAVEWEPGEIRYYVDGNLFQTRTPADLPPSARWVFDHPFFIVMNVAVGGGWPGNPDISTEFPQRLLVDYVRVYSRR